MEYCLRILMQGQQNQGVTPHDDKYSEIDDSPNQ